jgi:adenylate cyclase
MIDPVLLRRALQSLEVAVAVARPESGTIIFENAKFFLWFEPKDDVDAPIWTRFASNEAKRAQESIAQKQACTWQMEVQAGPRQVCLDIEVRLLEEEGADPLILFQARNISKQKEAEYMLDSYSKMAEKNAKELNREKERVEKLLLNIMPRSVYEEMRDYGSTTPQRFDAASVLMLDFVGFTDMAVSRDPSALITELNDIFSAFDRIVDLFNCERIKTIGDGYVAVSGLPEATTDHARNLAKVALRMRRYLERRNAAHPVKWRCRIGIATGPVIGSVVGIQKYVYDIFGYAPNLAARLEAQSAPMEISINEALYELLGDDFSVTTRGETELKGFGMMPVYALEFEHSAH